MKKIITLFLAAFCLNAATAQNNLGIGTATPNSSAKLDVSSTTQGMLIPRMTKAQRDAIATPATSLMIYQTDNTPGYYYNSGTPAAKNWVAVGGVSTTQLPNFFCGHSIPGAGSVYYASPFVLNTVNLVNSINSFLVSNTCTLNLIFHSFDDEALTFELFEVAPVANNNQYATTGPALASCSTAAWTSGVPISNNFSYSVATADKIYTIKITKTGGGNFSTTGGFYTSFYAN